MTSTEPISARSSSASMPRRGSPPAFPHRWKNGEGIAFAEPLPDGRWRAKKKRMARTMLGDADAALDPYRFRPAQLGGHYTRPS